MCILILAYGLNIIVPQIGKPEKGGRKPGST